MRCSSKDEISTLVTYLQDPFRATKQMEQKILEPAKTLFADNCASCHGDDAAGDREQGAPNLRDAIWLFGKDKKAIFETVHAGRKGMMPAWDGRLDPVTIRALAVLHPHPWWRRIGGELSAWSTRLPRPRNPAV